LTENVLRILWHLLEEKGCAKFGKIWESKPCWWHINCSLQSINLWSIL
jgi:hypothetical protein